MVEPSLVSDLVVNTEAVYILAGVYSTLMLATPLKLCLNLRLNDPKYLLYPISHPIFLHLPSFSTILSLFSLFKRSSNSHFPTLPHLALLTPM